MCSCACVYACVAVHVYVRLRVAVHVYVRVRVAVHVYVRVRVLCSCVYV